MALTRWLAVPLACVSLSCKLPSSAPLVDAASSATPVVTATVAARHDDGDRFVATVELRADGTTWFNGVVMRDDAALQDAARDAARKQPHLEAQVIAQPSVLYARVVHAMDLLRLAGISDVALGTAAPPPPTPVPRDR